MKLPLSQIERCFEHDGVQKLRSPLDTMYRELEGQEAKSPTAAHQARDEVTRALPKSRRLSHPAVGCNAFELTVSQPLEIAFLMVAFDFDLPAR